ncbi:V-type proton ATPase subunit S1-like protein [Bombina bombina]|uniref:V-type proton ATPase subunit S1-like protein n=1 Tax=Bombina bombina TaxID=8345 RepID=UPI00235ABC84|nr:V-type proton ATPase subunit S1-like protein [Bombina bombina]
MTNPVFQQNQYSDCSDLSCIPDTPALSLARQYPAQCSSSVSSRVRIQPYHNIFRKKTFLKRPVNENHHSPINITENGKTCILFVAEKIMLTFKDEIHLDLTDRTFGSHKIVDIDDSNCNEENATLSLKFGNLGNLKGLTLRFLLIKSLYKPPSQNWFKLQCVQILFNNSVQATYSTTRIFAPINFSYHCKHVTSIHKHDALLIPSSLDDNSKQWEITFFDFQIQGFNIEEGHFAYAKDCVTYLSPAIIMGLVMSLILLLVLAYILHMLIHLKSIDRHYHRKSSSTYFPKTKHSSLVDEREPLRGGLQECYELRSNSLDTDIIKSTLVQHCISGDL